MESLLDSARSLDPGKPAWVQALREEGLSRFSELGFPTSRIEDWKFTSLSPLTTVPFRRVAPAALSPAIRDQVESVRLGTGFEVVFVNGRVAPELSRRPGLPGGVRLGSLAEALRAEPDLVREHLGRVAAIDGHAFTALNAAFLEDGACLVLDRGVDLAEPVHLIFVATPQGAATLASPRNLMVAGEGSRATVVETWIGVAGEEPMLTNAVTEVLVGPNASVTHVKIQQEDDRAFHVATVEARQLASSRFRSHSISLGGALVRSDVGAAMQGEGAECALDGLYMVDGRRHVDHHTTIDHQKPHGTSRELYKGVLQDRASGVFNGKVYVRPDAQKSDAQQMNQNLLLSDDATINTKPQLEIFADDVKCSHGATIGRLDERALFYLRSRGIDAADARDILIYAFANELVGRLRVEPVRERLERVLASRLRADATEGRS